MPFAVGLLPIGTLLALLTEQVLATALAAQDVLVEKESFRCLSRYLQEVQPVLLEMRFSDWQDSNAARQALASLEEDVKKANALIERCTTKPRFYLLVNCRKIVKDTQSVTRDIGRSLQLLALANAEVSMEIRENVDRLQKAMMNAQFQTSESGQKVMHKLDVGLQEHKLDQGFANDLIREIAMAVGVPVNDSEMSKELASLKRAREEAAERKEREEEAFMEQVIALLERSDAARTPEVSRSRYYDMKKFMGSSLGESDEAIPALQPFKCPLTQDVMDDPVLVASGQTYEREYIQRWLDDGNTTDPVSGQELADTQVRPNGPLRKSIEEWRERNYCLSIRKAKAALQQEEESEQLMALQNIQRLCEKNSRNGHWIATEGIILDMLNSLGSQNRDLKKACLSAVFAVVKDEDENKDKVAEAGGVELIVRLLARESLSKMAIILLLELVQYRNGVNQKVLLSIEREKSAILLLVAQLSKKDGEVVEAAKLILGHLSNRDENVIQMAHNNLYNPLIDRLKQGSDETKLAMAKALGEMELTEQSKRSLGEGGVIPALAEMMASKGIEVRKEALGALRNLSTSPHNKAYIAQTNAVALVLDHLDRAKSAGMTESAAIILCNLFATNAASFLAEAGQEPEPVILTLLAAQANSQPTIRKHLLHALLGLVALPREKQLLRRSEGISQRLLPLLEATDPEIKSCGVQLIYCLSDTEEGSMDILLQMVQQGMAQPFVKFLEDGRNGEVQAAAAGILANLNGPNNDIAAALDAAEALPALLYMLRHGGDKAKENAVGAFLVFSRPSNQELQRKMVSLDSIPILVHILKTGSPLSQTRAAMVLGNLSKSTVHLTVPPRMTGCICLRPSRPAVCRVHQGRCDVKTTFCLLEANAVQGLVSLLKQGGKAAEAGVEALNTLVKDGHSSENGVLLLDEFDAVPSILALLETGTPKSKETAIRLLDCLLHVAKMQEKYASKAQDYLKATLTNDTFPMMKQSAAKLLARLDVIQEQSTYF